MPSRSLRLARVDPSIKAGPNARWHRVDGLEGPRVYVLVDFDENGEPVVASVQVVGAAVHAEHLRDIPLGRIERQLRFSLHETSSAYEQQPNGEQVLVDYTDTAPGVLTRRAEDESAEDFAKRVARAYRWHASRTGKPSVAMAEDSGVPVGTVRRWVKEARELGALEKGTRGRVG